MVLRLRSGRHIVYAAAMSIAQPSASAARKPSSSGPLWARLVDGSLPILLPATGLLAPDHIGLFYLALAVGFVGLGGVILTGASLVTFLSERTTDRIQGPRKKPAPMLREAADTALAAFVAAGFLAWPLWRSWTGRPIGLTWDLEDAGGLPLVLFQTGFGVLVLDGWLYLKHRLLHTRLLFPFHRAHHAYRDPTALAGFAVGPVESVLTFWPLLLIAIPEAKHWAPLYFLLVGGFISLNYYLHCGVKVEFLERLLSPFLLNTSAFHNIHHSHADANFGEAFTIWDRICRTRLSDRTTGPMSKS